MTPDFGAIVVGAGPAGEVCAGALADGGLRVAIAERELVGGECSYWGCIPSKTLVRPGEAAEAARQAQVPAEVDVPAALAWRDFMVSGYDDAGATGWLTGKGIEVLRGEAAIAGPGAVRVGDRTWTAEDVVIATGSAPVVPPVPGLHELAGVWTNREVTALREVPGRLVVLGGGAVGVEMAQAVARLGAEVVLVEGAGHLLAREPRPLGEALADVLRADGIEVHTGARVQAASREGDAYALTVECRGDGVMAHGPRHSVLRGDRLLVATGRRPRLPAGLERLEVDDRLRAGDRLWAVGDVTGIWPLTYVGKYQARVAAANILGTPARATYDAVPRVVFTDPQAAAVGVAEDRFASTVALADVPRTATYTREYRERPGFLTVLSDGERLTGAYALGPEAGEWLQQATVAIRARVPLDVLRDTIQPFPTFSEAFVQALAGLPAAVPEAALA